MKYDIVILDTPAENNQREYHIRLIARSDLWFRAASNCPKEEYDAEIIRLFQACQQITKTWVVWYPDLPSLYLSSDEFIQNKEEFSGVYLIIALDTPYFFTKVW